RGGARFRGRGPRLESQNYEPRTDPENPATNKGPRTKDQGPMKSEARISKGARGREQRFRHSDFFIRHSDLGTAVHRGLPFPFEMYWDQLGVPPSAAPS